MQLKCQKNNSENYLGASVAGQPAALCRGFTTADHTGKTEAPTCPVGEKNPRSGSGEEGEVGAYLGVGGGLPWWEDPQKKATFRDYRRRCRELGHLYFIDCLRENYARLIAWGFRGADPNDTWFWTGTFRADYVNPGHADRIWEQYIMRLEQSLNHMTEGRSRLRYVRADESQIRGTLHYHALMHGRGLFSLSRRHWEETWLNLAGICRIGTYCSYSAPYLSKYLSNGAQLQFGGDWRGRTAPHRLRCH